MELKFNRGQELSREQRSVPARLYNRLHLLFARSDSGTLFVPIRSMQYLAAVDQEEVIFVDGLGPRNIGISWRDFEVAERHDLSSPVGFTCIYYDPNGPQIMTHLQGEFLKALELVQERQPKSTGASVTPIDRH
ncbi:MAG: hypothetical protein RQ736_00810 [Thiogranum sp.]|nr:hypothetical protein [Thiogranum sp.]